MALSNSLKMQFAKTVSPEEKLETRKKFNATVIEQGGQPYVQIDGSEQITPLADRSVGVKKNDRVAVQIENHSVSLTGNLSDPAPNDSTIDEIYKRIEDGEGNLNEFRMTIDGYDLRIQNAEGAVNEMKITVDGYSQRITDVEGNVASFQTTVDGFSVQLGTVEDLANSAQSAADNAQSIANSADSKATSAQSTANNALDQVDDAKKVATNYLSYSSSGLVVGNVAGSLQGNVRLTSSGIEIRNGSTVYSSFTANEIVLGRYSTSSSIKLNGGYGTVSYNSGLLISASGTLNLRGANSGQTNIGYSGYTGSTSIWGRSLMIGSANTNSLQVQTPAGYKKIVALYRVFNRYDNDHVNCLQSEYNSLIRAGYDADGVTCYVFNA